MIFLSIVVVPFLKDKSYREEFFIYAAKKYSLYGTVITLSLLLITGLAISFLYHGGLRRTIYEKLFVFALILGISLIHDLWAGVRGISDRRYRSIAKALGLLNLILSLIAVFMGVRIRTGY
jgi:putative copper export protein